MTTKKPRKKTGPEFVFSGTIAPANAGWYAVYFDVDKNGATKESTLSVACWAAVVRGREHIVGGMVAGVNGLELAELAEDFRGYVHAEDNKDGAVDDFIEQWDLEHGYADDEEDEDEDEDDEAEDEDE